MILRFYKIGTQIAIYKVNNQLYENVRGKEMEKLIITVAPTGAQTTREHTPYVPLSPKEIADSVYESWKAGAAIAHIHVRDHKGDNTLDLDTYKEVIDRVQDKCDIILNLTTAGGLGNNEEARLRVCELNPEMATFDAGSMNFGQDVFHNTPTFLENIGDCYKRTPNKARN